MNDLNPMAQVDVEAKIMLLDGLLAQTSDEGAEAGLVAAHAEVAYKLAYARKILSLRDEKLAVALKESWALDSCAQEFEAMVLAEAIYKACQESGRNLRARLDGLRSINANVRDSVTHAYGTGG